MSAALHHGDCREVMASMEETSVDAIVTDPPYGLEFMGKGWDHGVPGAFFWIEALRVLKPGGHLLAFGGTRTFHRLTCAIEDAGFEVRDCLMWLYGSGFPKSLDVSKAIDKEAGAEREVIGASPYANRRPRADHSKQGVNFADDSYVRPAGDNPLTAPATDAARTWEGYGTALKPAWEPIIMARKPLIGTVAANVLEHGTGAINVDGGRIGTEEVLGRAKAGWPNGGYVGGETPQWNSLGTTKEGGRWPANVLLDPEAAAMLDEQSGERKTGDSVTRSARLQPHQFQARHDGRPGLAYTDRGGASRFFYTAKTSSAERSGSDGAGGTATKNDHPTVKPVDLMAYLVKLVTPPEGTVLDPFMGSGSTGIAALRLGFEFVGIEREENYLKIAEARIREDAPLFNAVEAGK